MYIGKRTQMVNFTKESKMGNKKLSCVDKEESGSYGFIIMENKMEGYGLLIDLKLSGCQNLLLVQTGAESVLTSD